MAGVLKARIEDVLRGHDVLTRMFSTHNKFSYEINLMWSRKYNAYFERVRSHIFAILICFARIGIPGEIATEHLLEMMFMVRLSVFKCCINPILLEYCHLFPGLRCEIEHPLFPEISVGHLSDKFEYMCVGRFEIERMSIAYFDNVDGRPYNCLRQHMIYKVRATMENVGNLGNHRQRVYISRDAAHHCRELVYCAADGLRVF